MPALRERTREALPLAILAEAESHPRRAHREPRYRQRGTARGKWLIDHLTERSGEMITTPQDQRGAKPVRTSTGIELLPDALVLNVLHFSSDSDRCALVFASKAIATRLKEQRETLVTGIFSSDSREQLRAAARLDSLLDVDNAPIRLAVKTAGLVPRFVEFLNRFERDSVSLELQFAALRVLDNIAAAGHADVVVDAGAVPMICRLGLSPALSSDDQERREQAIWALGSIAEDSPTSRDLVLREGVTLPLFQMLDRTCDLMLFCVTRTLAKILVSALPDGVFDSIRPRLHLLTRLIHSPEKSVLINACEALANLCGGEEEDIEDRIQAVLDVQIDLNRRMMELLGHASADIQVCALRVLAVVISGPSEAQMRTLLDLQILPCLLPHLSNHDIEARLDACWILTNVARDSDNVQSILDEDLIPPLVQLLSAPESEGRYEAAQSLSAIADQCSFWEQIDVLIRAGCVLPLCELLSDEVNYHDDSYQNADHLVRILQILHRIVLKDDNETNCIIYSKAGGKLRKLRTHADEFVRAAAAASRVRIIRAQHRDSIFSQVALLGTPLFRKIPKKSLGLGVISRPSDTYDPAHAWPARPGRRGPEVWTSLEHPPPPEDH